MEHWIVRRAKPEEQPLLPALADRCFGYGDGWFSTNMAKMYTPKRPFYRDHLVVERDQTLAGMLAMNRQQWVVGDTALSCIGVGTVCTAPEFRGQGVLQRMMTSALHNMAFLDADFSFLCGRYTRYHHFGFEACGMWYDAEIAAKPAAGYTFRQLCELSPEERRAVVLFHEDRPIYGRRPEELLTEIGSEFGMCTYVVYQNGTLEGTIGFKPKLGEISELEIIGDTKTAAASFLASQGIERAKLVIPGYDADLLAQFPEAKSREEDGQFPPKDSLMIHVWHFEKMVGAWFPLHAQKNHLPDGELVLELPDSRLLIAVHLGVGTVTPTRRAPDVVLTHDEAVRFLFHPAGYAVNDAVDALSNAWFPLPFALMNGEDF